MWAFVPAPLLPSEALPAAQDWSASNVIVFNQGSPAPTMSVIDITNGVRLNYDAPTGGFGVGTSTRRYTFAATAASSTTVTFDLDVDAVNGTFDNTFVLQLVQNGAVVRTLASSTSNAFSGSFPGESLQLNAGDVWGVQVTAGNFSQSTGTRADIDLMVQPCALGDLYCTPSIPNSTGLPATIQALGSALVGDNDVALKVTNVPPFQFGLFLTSMTQGFVSNPGGSQGDLCLGGQVGRYNSDYGYALPNAGSEGELNLELDLNNTPQPSGSVTILAGQTWNFQCWYRDFNPGATSNFSDAITVTFQ